MLVDGKSKIRPKQLMVFGLAVAVLLVYGQTATFDFIHSYDDREYVVSNPYIRDGITLPAIGWAFTTFYAANWHPVTWLSHMADVVLFGANPGGHHLTSVILHLFNTLLLFHLLQRMTAATWRSAAVAALFALHPLHVESVAMVAERKDVLSTFFWLMALESYISYTRRPLRRWYALALGFFALGLMSKPMVVSLPFVLLLLDYWPLQRWQGTRDASGPQPFSGAHWRPLLIEKIPFFLLSAVTGLVTLLAQQSKGATGSMEVYSFFQRLANAAVSYVSYLVKTVWPDPLVVFYPYRDPVPAWQWLVCAGLLVAVTTAVISCGRNRRYLVSGWFWYLGTLLPVIGIVQVGAQSMADRYTYIPLIGIFITVVWGLSEAGQWLRLKKSIAVSAAVACLLVYGLLTWKQVGLWESDVRLFSHAAAHTGDNWVAHNNLGSALVRQGQPEAALVHYQRTLEIKPAYADARYNLAVALSGLGRNPEAIGQYRQVLTMQPEHSGALNNLCGELIAAGQPEEGLDHCRKAVKNDPKFAKPLSNMAVALSTMGQQSQAIELYRRSLQLAPDNAQAHLSLGLLLASAGQMHDALQHFQSAVELDPTDELIWRQAADALMTAGNFAAAADFYSSALRLKSGSADTYNSLGVAFARTGRRSDAVIMFQEALKKDADHAAAARNLERALAAQQ